jgi:hypothetical protein
VKIDRRVVWAFIGMLGLVFMVMMHMMQVALHQ